MKDFKTFLKEQAAFSKGTVTKQPTLGLSDKKDTIASMSQGDKTLVRYGDTSNRTFLNNMNTKTVYDFSKVLDSMESLDKIILRDDDKKKLKSVIDKMPDSYAKRQLIQNMQDTVGLPKSADRTRRVQSIVNQINQYDMEARGVPRSASIPQNFTPQTIASWSNR